MFSQDLRDLQARTDRTESGAHRVRPAVRDLEENQDRRVYPARMDSQETAAETETPEHR